MKKRLAIILSMVMLLLVGVVGCTSGDNKTMRQHKKKIKQLLLQIKKVK